MRVTDPPPRNAPLLTRVSIRNYKSIAQADVQLGAFTILVGRNGSGKSNFLDALHVVTDGLQDSLGFSLRKRGGFNEIRTRGTRENGKIAFRLEISFPDRRLAIYTLEIAGEPFGSVEIHLERLDILSASGSIIAHYEVKGGKVRDASVPNMPPAFPDRIYLVNAAGFGEFRFVYDFLVAMGFYNIAPEPIRTPQRPDGGGLLRGDGSNIASVIKRLRAAQPETMDRINQYMEVIVPGILGVENEAIQDYETLLFSQKVKGFPMQFNAARMSDGTLRVLAILVAAAQLSNAKTPVSLVGIEEPEAALHPAAAAALMDALQERASRTQILITSHSPDLLDYEELGTENLLAVTSTEGMTKIAPIDRASLNAIKKHLFTPGELLKLDQLEPDREDLARQEREPLLAGKGEGET
jgi:predicted ATPase